MHCSRLFLAYGNSLALPSDTLFFIEDYDWFSFYDCNENLYWLFGSHFSGLLDWYDCMRWAVYTQGDLSGRRYNGVGWTTLAAAMALFGQHGTFLHGSKLTVQ